MIEIPVHFMVYAGCLFGGIYMSWRKGIRHGITLTLDSLAAEGVLTFAEEDE